MNRYLISVVTPSYVPKTVQYFSTLPLIVSAQTVTVLLDFNPTTDPDGSVEGQLRGLCPWQQFRKMDLPPTHSNFMVQDSFMGAFPDLQDDDLVCLTDMDGFWQRDLTEKEWEWMAEVAGKGSLLAYYNGGKVDNLQLEGERIGLSGEWVRENCSLNPAELGCWNCGFMVGQAGSFRYLQKVYGHLWDSFSQAAPHRSRCQWLINYLVHLHMGGFVTLPPQVHAQGHFRDPHTGAVLLAPKSEVRGKVLCCEGIPVAFCHALPELWSSQ